MAWERTGAWKGHHSQTLAIPGVSGENDKKTGRSAVVMLNIQKGESRNKVTELEKKMADLEKKLAGFKKLDAILDTEAE